MNLKFQISNFKFPSRGFTLVEVLIVMAIIGVIAAAGAGFYRAFVKNVEVQTTSKVIASDLRQMRAKSMIGESGYKWAVRFVKNANGDYYYTYSTDGVNSTTTATTTLATGVTFIDPPSGTKDVIFSKISGTTTATAVVIIYDGKYSTTTITGVGTIY